MFLGKPPCMPEKRAIVMPLRTDGLKLSEVLVIFGVVLAGTGMYWRIGGTQVNLSLSDGVLVLAVFAMVLHEVARPRSIRADACASVIVLLGFLWLGCIFISFTQPLVGAYANSNTMILAAMKAAVSIAYLLWMPLYVNSGLVGQRAIVLSLQSWCIVSSTIVLMSRVPAFRSTLYFAGLRLQGLFRDPNLYALYAGQAGIIASGFAVCSRRLNRLNYIAQWILCTLGVVLSGSRTAMVAYGLSSIALAIAEKRMRRLAPTMLLLCLCIIVVSPLREQLSWSIERLGWGSYSEGLASRSHVWEDAILAAKAHPLTGVGRGHLVSWRERHGLASRLIAHNTYIGVFAETGVLGAVIFSLLFMGLPVRLATRLLRMTGERGIMGRTLCAAFVCTWVGALGLDVENYRLGWLVVGMAAALVMPCQTSDVVYTRQQITHPTGQR